MNYLIILGCAASYLFAFTTTAADYRVEVLEESAPADSISQEIADQLSPTGFRIIRGESRKMFDIWLCKQWELPSAFKASAEIAYPFNPGQLIGVARFNNKSADFREQEIPEGVYTIRYGQQPVDGDHVGTAPTRDFFVLIKAEDDQTTDVLDYDTLVEQSAEAVDSTHPAQLLLARTDGDSKAPSMRHNEEKDWWSLRFEGQAKQGDSVKTLQLELIVVGHADE